MSAGTGIGASGSLSRARELMRQGALDAAGAIVDEALARAPRDADATDVRVAYERTSLAPDANDNVRHLGDSDRRSGPEWGDAINAYFAKR